MNRLAIWIVLSAAAGPIYSAEPQSRPATRPAFSVADYGAAGDGKTLCTAAIQKAIDAAAQAGGAVTFPAGTYVSGAIFVKSGVELRLDEGATLQAIEDDAQYPLIATRVAGIEMTWPAALVNVYEQKDVLISGKGVIDGNGQFWWKKFYSMLDDYTRRGLRWAVDYDCKRVRALAVYNSQDVAVRDVTIRRSGFWSLTLTYCQRVTVTGVTIRANIGGKGPSSDGIDIDSSSHVLVEHCDIDCNDDNICLKAGRDADGLRVNRPTEHIVIRDCIARAGHGLITLGSETSGGIRDVEVSGLKAERTSNGIRFKSAKVRGGVVENIRIRDIEMTAVENPIIFDLNWYPSYSYAKIPANIPASKIPPHWKVLAQRVDPAKGIPEFRDITISDVKATGAKVAISSTAYPEKPMRNVRLENISIESQKAGSIRHAADWTMKNVTIRTPDAKGVSLKDCTNVPAPTIQNP